MCLPSAPALVDLSGATSDDHLVALWLGGKSPHTVRAYTADVASLRAAVSKPLRALTLADLQAWAAGAGARAVAAVKSLLVFGQRTGYLAFNVGAAVRVKVARRLADRILTQEQVVRMLALTDSRRDHALLRVLYVLGLRVSETTALTWGDLQERDGGSAQVTVMGKGSRVRAVLVPAGLRAELAVLRGDAAADAPMFPSRTGRALDESAALRVVRAAAGRAGITGQVTPHWLRHSHATHAIARGASLHLVQQTLGHASLATTGAYLHAMPSESSSLWVGE